MVGDVKGVEVTGVAGKRWLQTWWGRKPAGALKAGPDRDREVGDEPAVVYGVRGRGDV
ncbi:hypothetical protein GCM10023083_83560 [Streptomyces phyllanthi]